MASTSIQGPGGLSPDWESASTPKSPTASTHMLGDYKLSIAPDSPKTKTSDAHKQAVTQHSDTQIPSFVADTVEAAKETTSSSGATKLESRSAQEIPKPKEKLSPKDAFTLLRELKNYFSSAKETFQGLRAASRGKGPLGLAANCFGYVAAQHFSSINKSVNTVGDTIEAIIKIDEALIETASETVAVLASKVAKYGVKSVGFAVKGFDPKGFEDSKASKKVECFTFYATKYAAQIPMYAVQLGLPIALKTAQGVMSAAVSGTMREIVKSGLQKIKEAIVGKPEYSNRTADEILHEFEADDPDWDSIPDNYESIAVPQKENDIRTQRIRVEADKPKESPDTGVQAEAPYMAEKPTSASGPNPKAQPEPEAQEEPSLMQESFTTTASKPTPADPFNQTVSNVADKPISESEYEEREAPAEAPTRKVENLKTSSAKPKPDLGVKDIDWIQSDEIKPMSKSDLEAIESKLNAGDKEAIQKAFDECVSDTTEQAKKLGTAFINRSAGDISRGFKAISNNTTELVSYGLLYAAACLPTRQGSDAKNMVKKGFLAAAKSLFTKSNFIKAGELAKKAAEAGIYGIAFALTGNQSKAAAASKYAGLGAYIVVRHGLGVLHFAAKHSKRDIDIDSLNDLRSALSGRVEQGLARTEQTTDETATDPIPKTVIIDDPSITPQEESEEDSR